MSRADIQTAQQRNVSVMSVRYKDSRTCAVIAQEQAVMQNPIDYPVADDNGSLPPGPMTVGLLLDMHKAQQPITEEMIRSATRNLEAAQQFPFAGPPETIDPDVSSRHRSEPVLARLLDVIR